MDMPDDDHIAKLERLALLTCDSMDARTSGALLPTLVREKVLDGSPGQAGWVVVRAELETSSHDDKP